MSKKFKQLSTGLILVCERKDVIDQYEKYPELYEPLNDKKVSKEKTGVDKTDKKELNLSEKTNKKKDAK